MVKFTIITVCMYLTMLTACGTSNFMTKHGFYFETNGNRISKAEVEMAADILAIVFENMKKYTEKDIKRIYDISNYVIQVRSENFDCSFESKKKVTCKGLHEGNLQRIQYVNKTRLSDSSLIHELIHLIKSKMEGYADSRHLDIDLWVSACKKKFTKDETKRINCEMNSIEGFTNSILRNLEDRQEKIIYESSGE